MVTKIKKVSLIFCSAALVFTAAGCVGSADPVEPTPTVSTPTAPASSSPPTTSPSPSIKPTPKPIPASSTGPAKNWPVPVMPDAAKDKTEAGVNAFVLYYFKTIEYTINTNDTKPLKKLTTKDCESCYQEFIHPFDGNKKAGSWVVGVKLEPVITRSVVDGNGGVALFTLTQGKMIAYMSDGTQYGVFPAVENPNPGTSVLTYDSSWKVSSLEIEAKS